MRGDDQRQAGMFSYVSPEQRVPADHPLRPMRKMLDEALQRLSRQFDGLYSDTGRLRPATVSGTVARKPIFNDLQGDLLSK